MSRAMAPPVASARLPRSKPVTGPYPSRLPAQPPIMAPAMPMRTVAIRPPGSFPGMRYLATVPTMSPRTIQPRMLILLRPGSAQGNPGPLAVLPERAGQERPGGGARSNTFHREHGTAGGVVGDPVLVAIERLELLRGSGDGDADHTQH